MTYWKKPEFEDSQYWMAQIQIYRDVMRYVRKLNLEMKEKAR